MFKSVCGDCDEYDVNRYFVW